MIERTGSKDEIGIESEGRDPMSVILECMQEFTLQMRSFETGGSWRNSTEVEQGAYTVRIPDAYCSVTGSGIQRTLSADATASPSDHVHAGRMTSERVFQPPCGARPDPYSSVFGG